MRVPFVELLPATQEIREELWQRWDRLLQESAFTLGEAVEEFERAFGEYCGARHTVGVNNGTDAIILALQAAGIGPGDEVIVPAFTFVATAEAVLLAGAKPVLVDVDLETYTMDPETLDEAATPRTKAVIPVHLYGQTADITRIRAWADRKGTPLIEDAAQAHGAKHRGVRAGALAPVACFSFYPGKNLGSFGSGGAVLARDDDFALRVRKLRTHGGTQKYVHEMIDHNSRLDALQAVVLRLKLDRLEEWNRRRQELAAAYDELLSGVRGIVPPRVRSGDVHVYHLFVIRVEVGTREDLQAELARSGIETIIHYPQAVHLTPAFSSLGYREGRFPVAERCAAQVLSLPMYPHLERGQLEYVAERIREYARRRS